MKSPRPQLHFYPDDGLNPKPGEDRRSPSRIDDTIEVLRYLKKSPIVILGPATPAQRPDYPPLHSGSFATDGANVFPLTFLDLMKGAGIWPPESLVEHIRANNYEVPGVSPECHRAALAAVAEWYTSLQSPAGPLLQ